MTRYLAVALLAILAACATNDTDSTSEAEVGAGEAVRDSKADYSRFVARQAVLELSEDGPDGSGLGLHYTELGDPADPAVVLLHGVPTSSWMFRKVLDELGSSNLRLVAPDNIGYGTSTKPDPLDGRAAEFFGPAAQARRLDELLTHLGIDKAVFVVHDIGGPILWELAESRPQLVAGLVVLNTIGAPGGFNPPPALDDPLVRAIMEMVGVEDERTISDLICRMVAEPEKLDTPEQLEGYLAGFRQGSGDAYLAFLTNLDLVRARLYSYQQTIAELSGVPACVLWGGQDENLPAEPGAGWFSRVLGVAPEDTYVFDDAKHLVAEEKSGQIADLITQIAAQAY